MTAPSSPGSAAARRAPGAGRPAGPGVPLSVWAGLPVPACPPPGQPCAGPVTAEAAVRITRAFTRPGDLVASIGSPAVSEATAAAGRPGLGLAPSGLVRLVACGDPGAGTAALVITGCHEPGCCPGPAPGPGWLLYAACERVLRPGGVLAVLTPGPGSVTSDRAGGIVAAARATGLVYAQHIVLVHAEIDGDRLDPAEPTPAGPAGDTRIHSDLLVFTKPGKPVSPQGDLRP